MSLDDLADRTLLYLADYIAPNDIEAFASVSRRVRSLSSARLARHRELRSKWTSVVLNKFTEDENAIDHPVRVLHAIWKDPDIKYYIQYIVYALENSPDMVRHGHESFRLNDDIWIMIDKIHSDDSLYQAAPYFSHSETRNKRDLTKCREGIQTGEEPLAFILLLASLPNLRRLRFSFGFTLDNGMLASMIAFSASDPHAQVLSKLSTVEHYHWDTEGEDEIATSVMFSLLPSVRTIKGAHVGGGDTVTMIPGWRNAVSYVENIEISGGAIDFWCLKDFLLPMRNLREFRYSHIYYGDSWDIHEWVDILAETVGDRLEVLSLTTIDGTWDNGEGDTVTRAKSFKSFKKLRELEILVEALVGDEGNDMDLDEDALEEGFHHAADTGPAQLVPRLVDILPSSIETITLIGNNRTEDTELLFCGIEMEKGDCLPRLSRVVHTGPLKQTVRDRLSSVGIEKQTIYTSYADHVYFWLEDKPEGIRFWDA